MLGDVPGEEPAVEGDVHRHQVQAAAGGQRQEHRGVAEVGGQAGHQRPGGRLDVVARHPEAPAGRGDVGGQRRRRHRDALGGAGRAGGVDDVGEVVPGARASRCSAPAGLALADGADVGRQHRAVRVVGDHHGHPRVAQLEGDPGRRVLGVQGDVAGAQAQAGQDRHHRGRGAVQAEPDRRAGSDPETGQHPRQRLDALLQGAVADDLVTVPQRRGVGAGPGQLGHPLVHLRRRGHRLLGSGAEPGQRHQGRLVPDLQPADGALVAADRAGQGTQVPGQPGRGRVVDLGGVDDDRRAHRVALGQALERDGHPLGLPLQQRDGGHPGVAEGGPAEGRALQRQHLRAPGGPAPALLGRRLGHRGTHLREQRRHGRLEVHREGHGGQPRQRAHRVGQLGRGAGVQTHAHDLLGPAVAARERERPEREPGLAQAHPGSRGGRGDPGGHPRVERHLGPGRYRGGSGRERPRQRRQRGGCGGGRHRRGLLALPGGVVGVLQRVGVGDAGRDGPADLQQGPAVGDQGGGPQPEQRRPVRRLPQGGDERRRLQRVEPDRAQRVGHRRHPAPGGLDQPDGVVGPHHLQGDPHPGAPGERRPQHLVGADHLGQRGLQAGARAARQLQHGEHLRARPLGLRLPDPLLLQRGVERVGGGVVDRHGVPPRRAGAGTVRPGGWVMPRRPPSGVRPRPAVPAPRRRRRRAARASSPAGPTGSPSRRDPRPRRWCSLATPGPARRRAARR